MHLHIDRKFFRTEPAGTDENWLPLILKLSVYAWLTYFFYQAAATFSDYYPGKSWPLMLSVFRTFTFLPLHEGGHFLFMFFGRTLYILGGSFWQVMFPLLWFIIAAKQRSNIAPFALFWVGENMLDVSLYMRDAPVRQLPLLGGHRSGHDWYNLFSQWNLMDFAGTIADIMYYSGFIICTGAIIAGIALAFKPFFTPARQPAPLAPSSQAALSSLENSLDNIIEKKDRQTFS